ncbi:hypothetical protein HDU86_002885 [Geranomyces michiganensis]|nr:hypothetical protein HDU86_002885 [Geranomyces michiganensis]
MAETADDLTARLQAELSDVKRQLAECQAEIKEHEDFRTESKELETELEHELEDLKALNEKLTRENAELKSKHSALQSDANNNLNALQSELERLRTSDAANRERVRDLETAFSELEQTNRATEASAATSLAQFAELAERAAFLEEEVDSKRAMEGDMQRLRDQIKEHEEELARLRARQLASLSSAGLADGSGLANRSRENLLGSGGGTPRDKLGEDEMAARKANYAELRKSGQLFSPAEIAALDTDYKNDTPARRAQQAELRRAFQEEARLSMANMVSRAQALEKRMAAVRATYANYRVKSDSTSASENPVSQTSTSIAANTVAAQPPESASQTPSKQNTRALSETGGKNNDSGDEGNDDADEGSGLEESGFDEMDVDAPRPAPTSTPAPTVAVDDMDVDLLTPDAAVIRPETEANTALAIDKVDKAQDRAALEAAMDVEHRPPPMADNLLSPEAAVSKPEAEADTSLPLERVDAAQDRAAMEGVQQGAPAQAAQPDLLSPEAAVTAIKPEIAPNTALPIGKVDAAQDRVAMEGVGDSAVEGHASPAAGSALVP